MKKSNKIMLLALLILQTKAYSSSESDLHAQENKHRAAAEMLKRSILEQYDNQIQQLDKTSPNFETEKKDLDQKYLEKLSHVQLTLTRNILNLDAAPDKTNDSEQTHKNNFGSNLIGYINPFNYLKSK